MTQKLYQVDAFASELFAGNPAAVCPLTAWLDDRLMQRIAMENNLAETTFFVNRGAHFEIRWFTPMLEVDLCGHATLAAAFVLFNQEGFAGDKIQFQSHRSGPLAVTREGDQLVLDFPADPVKQIEIPPSAESCFGKVPLEVYRGKTDCLFVFGSEKEIRELNPDLSQIAKLKARGVIVTAKGDTVDFVSRFFAPQSGIDEDPVTGSAHTTLTPFWSSRLNKKKLTARQLSKRGGQLVCEHKGDRVMIAGSCCLYLSGEIKL
jgi:PhzF family phenazine biosynthesis protein